MRFTKLFIIPVFILFANTIIAQSQGSLQDSLAKKLQLVDSLKYRDADLAISIAKEVQELAIENELQRVHASANKLLANIYAEKGDYSAALKVINTAISIYQELNDDKQLCIGYIYSGIIHRYLKLYQESIDAYHKAETLAEELNENNSLSSIYGNLGNVYYDISDYEKAFEYHQKSLEIDEELGNREGMGNSYHNIGLLFKEQGRYEMALEYFKKSLEVDLTINNQRNIAISYLDFIDLYMALGDTIEAKEYAYKSLKITQEIPSKRLEKQVLGKLSILEAISGNTSAAFDAQQSFIAATDSFKCRQLARTNSRIRS